MGQIEDPVKGESMIKNAKMLLSFSYLEEYVAGYPGLILVRV
jgi:hypothetical protein